MLLLVTICLNIIVVLVGLAALAYFLARWWLQQNYKKFHMQQDGSEKFSVAFFHPYCNAGGGGERVLWCALRSIQNRCPDVECIVYTGDKDVTAAEILEKARTTFNIELPRPVTFVFLKNRYLVEARLYHCATLLGQSLGSIILGMEALAKFVPTVYLDTMGYAFTMPLFKYLGNCRVGCYVHYPTISMDMLAVVAEHKETFNNARAFSRNPLLRQCKLTYYRLFAAAYSTCGRSADIIMVNSSWTAGHIKQLWRRAAKTFTVYPPCDVEAFRALPLVANRGPNFVIVSVAQFRPEKNHQLQLKALQLLLKKLPLAKRANTKLVLVGSCRNEEDEARVGKIRKLARSIKVDEHIEVKLNVSFEELKEIMTTADVGIHTMWNEHFGIGVVEMMAAGTVVLAHDSGGPKMDIVIPHEGKPTGFLASTAEEYADALCRIITMPEDLLLEMRNNGRHSVQRFSEAEFVKKFTFATASLIPWCR